MATEFAQLPSKGPPQPAGWIPDAPMHEFTNLEVGQAVSRELNLPIVLAAVAGLASKLRDFVNSSPEYRSKGLQEGGIRSLILTNLTPEIAALLDPAQAAKIRAEQQAKANITSADGARTLGEGYRLVNGVWVRNDKGDKSELALSSRGGNEFAELRGKASASEVAPGTGYSWLTPANQNIPGFNQAQVAASANFLKSIGFTREQVNEATQHMVHLQPYRSEIKDFVARQQDIDRRRARGENVDADQSKLDADKAGTRSRMTPEDQKHFDLLPVIRKQDRKGVELKGDQQAAHDDSQETLSSEVRAIGASKIVEDDHAARVAQMTAAPTAGDDIAARLARRAHPQAGVETPPSAPKPAAGPSPTSTASSAPLGTTAKGPNSSSLAGEAKTEQRQATNTKAPTMSA